MTGAYSHTLPREFSILETHSDQLLKDGVTLLRNCIPELLINTVANAYEQLNGKLTRTDIPSDRPVIVFWKHVPGESKRIGTFEEIPSLWQLIENVIVPRLLRSFPDRIERLQLLETIIFDKPPITSNTLHWHQDTAYFPMQPKINQLAVWTPFSTVIKETGAMRYALGSHKAGERGSTNLHDRTPFANEDRPLIPDSPEADGYKTRTFEITPCDMIVHDGMTWHTSGPNTVAGRQRRGLSVRFITGPSTFEPHQGQGAAFTAQMQAINIAPGDVVRGSPFPVF